MVMEVPSSKLFFSNEVEFQVRHQTGIPFRRFKWDCIETITNMDSDCNISLFGTGADFPSGMNKMVNDLYLSNYGTFIIS